MTKGGRETSRLHLAYVMKNVKVFALVQHPTKSDVFLAVRSQHRNFRWTLPSTNVMDDEKPEEAVSRLFKNTGLDYSAFQLLNSPQGSFVYLPFAVNFSYSTDTYEGAFDIEGYEWINMKQLFLGSQGQFNKLSIGRYLKV